MNDLTNVCHRKKIRQGLSRQQMLSIAFEVGKVGLACLFIIGIAAIESVVELIL